MAEENSIVGKKIKAVPKKDVEIGIDTNNTLITDILDEAEVSQIELSNLEGFSNVSQTREQVYTLIDTMAEDDRVSSVLETYAEDVVETNDEGQVIWCESSDENVSKYVNYLLDALNVNKNAYEWTYSLIKYGDVYLKLYKESDYGEDLLFGTSKDENKQLNESKDLKEDVNVHLHLDNDKYVHYVELVPNPAEMFELTKFGKTMGYIKAPVRIQTKIDSGSAINTYMTYKIKKNDVDVYSATDYVHASLTNDNSMRNPEEVQIFTQDENDNETDSSTYKVKKGQSILYNLFRIWRELSLLENSVLLNRLTKSAIVRILNVDVGDMPKEQVSGFMQRLKSKIEQKSALNVGQSMQEYNNPGPIENIIYVPTHGTQGTINAQAIGGDVDPKQLTDLEYFLNKFYGSLRVPKQYFAQTDDSAGFNGGQSLSIISSRYGKVIKRIQNTMCQLVTDLINLFLLDRGLNSYVNRFTIRMQSPITQEEIDKRENLRNRMGVMNDIMSQIGNVVTDEVLKLKIVKSLLSTIISEPDVIQLIQDQIDLIESEKEEGKEDTEKPKGKRPLENEPSPRFNDTDFEDEYELEDEEEIEEPMERPELEEPSEPEEQGEESYLPTPDELGVDLTTND